MNDALTLKRADAVLGIAAACALVWFSVVIACAQPHELQRGGEYRPPAADRPLFTAAAKAEAARTGRAWFEFGGTVYVVEDVSGWGDWL